MLPQEWNLRFPFPPHSPYLFKTFVHYFCLYQATLTRETRFLNSRELGSLSSWNDMGFLETPNQLLLSMEKFLWWRNHHSHCRAPCCGSSWYSGSHQGLGKSIRQDWLCTVLSWLCLTKLTSFLWTLDFMLL